MLQELIETLWNVNSKIQQILSNVINELIETLWNVNRKTKEYYIDILGINRNIVECKYGCRIRS